MLRVVSVLPAIVLTAASCSGGSSDGAEATTPPSVETTQAAPTQTAPTEQASQDRSADGAVGAASSESDQRSCDALSVIVDLSDEIGVAQRPLEAIVATGDVDAVITDEAQAVADSLEAGSDDLDEAYVVAVDAAPDDLRSDLETLASATPLLLRPLIDILRVATTPGDLAGFSAIFEDEAIAEAAVSAGQATARIDDFTVATCGFGFANS